MALTNSELDLAGRAATPKLLESALKGKVMAGDDGGVDTFCLGDGSVRT